MKEMTSKLWEENLEEDMFYRLCDCANRRSDLVPMAKVVKNVLGLDKEDAFIYVLEWVGDLNGQYNTTDLTVEEYDNMLSQI